MGKIRSIPKVSCAILAGGRSKRMGTDKSFLEVAGRPLFEWTLESLEGLGEELFVVTNSPEKYRQWGLPAVPDIIPGHGTMGDSIRLCLMHDTSVSSWWLAICRF